MNRISHSQLFCRFNRNKNVQYYMLCTSVGCPDKWPGRDFNTSSACGSFTYAGSLQTKRIFSLKKEMLFGKFGKFLYFLFLFYGARFPSVISGSY